MMLYSPKSLYNIIPLLVLFANKSQICKLRRVAKFLAKRIVIRAGQTMIIATEGRFIRRILVASNAIQTMEWIMR